jgi:hypothetical protein
MCLVLESFISLAVHIHTTTSKYLPAFLDTPSTCTDIPTNEQIVRMVLKVAQFDEEPRYVPFVNNHNVAASSSSECGLIIDVGVSVGSIRTTTISGEEDNKQAKKRPTAHHGLLARELKKRRDKSYDE